MHGHFRHTPTMVDRLVDINIPFDNTTPIYLINLLWIDSDQSA